MRDNEQRTNEQTLKIELLSQWKLEAEFRNLFSISSLLFSDVMPHVVPGHAKDLLMNILGWIF